MGYIVSGLVVRTLAFVLLLPGLVYGLSSSKFRFKLNQLYEVSVGLENLRGTPLAFGDLSGTNDQLVDLVIASADQKTVEVWEWSRSAREFSHAAAADIKVADGFLVSNAIVGDFDADGHLDILLQSVSTKTKEVRMQLFLGNSSSSLGFAAYGGDIDSANDAMPFAIDYDGSGCVALLGGAPWSQRDNATAPPAWMWASEPAQAAALLTARPATLFQPINSTAAPTAMCRPASPHSSAFVDVDGDCRADLFVVCEGGTDYQIWASGSERGYTYSQTGQLPAGAGAVAFADMNGDGSVDMVVAMPGKSQIQILYNEQRPLCIGKNGRDCRDFERICEADAQFAFSAPADAQVVDFSAAWPGETLLAALADFQGPAPAAVRVGDVDLDGFPDLAFVTTRAGGETRVRLMRSAACSGCHAGGTRRRVDVRSYVAVTDGVAVLEQVNGAQDVAFFDVDGTGRADLLIYYRDGRGQKRATAAYNNFFTDTFFIKASAGRGAAFKYVLVDDTGRKHVAQTPQAPQSAYRAMLTPYALIGIGRTNNYIEDFSVGSPGFWGHHDRAFEGLIPNSRVVVFPKNDTAEWRLELYMNRSESTPYILATLLSSMAVLAVTVVVLGKMERRADQREKQRALHAINFDAL